MELQWKFWVCRNCAWSEQIMKFSSSLLLRLYKWEVSVTGLKSTTNYIYKNTLLQLFEKINLRISYSCWTQSEERFLPFLPLTSLPSRSTCNWIQLDVNVWYVRNMKNCTKIYIYVTVKPHHTCSYTFEITISLK